MTRALLVPVHGNPRIVEYETLADMRELIGCELVDSVPWLFGDEPACYVDDEGIYRQEPNRAVFVDGELATVLFGNMLFVGFDRSTGADRDITDREADMVMRRFTVGAEGEGSGMAAIIAMRREQVAREAKRRLKENGKI